MFFSASARLAEATTDLGDLAARLDSYLEHANESWVIDPVELASALHEDEDKVRYLLGIASDDQVALLVAETYLTCRYCENLMSRASLQEALELEEQLECTQCHEALAGDEIETTVYRLAPTAAAEARARATRPQRTVVVLTALEVEVQAVQEHLTELVREVHEAGTVYHVGYFKTSRTIWRVGTVAVGAGNPGAAAEAERAISHFRPEYALFVGVAGGIKDVALGDVVAATEVYLYHSGKALKDFKPRPEVFRSAYALVSQARAAALERMWQERIATEPRQPPKALVEPIAAGEEVVANQRSPTYSFIRDQYDRAVAVEMEGAGFLRAAYGNQEVKALVIRGISDLLENKQQADDEGWQAFASRHASAFAFELLTNLG